MQKTKLEIAKEVQQNTSLSKNRVRLRKPISTVCMALWLAAIVLLSAFTVIHADCFSSNLIAVLVAVEASIVSFYIVVYTSNQSKQEAYREAKKDAMLLSQLLDFINSQIIRMNIETKLTIAYPSTWMDYYRNCASYLDYNYLGYILREFDLVDKINSCITNHDKAGLEKVLAYRKRLLTDGELDFNILSVKTNLSRFANSETEEKPWKQDRKYMEFRDFIVDNYSVRIKELTVVYLKEHGNACDSNDARYYVMNKLREESAIKSGKYRFEAMENNKLLSAIFVVYLALDEKDEFSLCWGELTLKS